MALWEEALSSLGGSAVDFGFQQAGAAMSYKYARKLRRKAYQDTVHSMRQAGLNPILAARQGPAATLATPMPAAMQTAGNMARLEASGAAKTQSETAKNLARSQSDVNAATAEEAREAAGVKREEQVTERYRQEQV